VASRTVSNRIWIINYYAAPPQFATMFRHICFAREMQRAGYDVKIFCASALHNRNIEIDMGGKSHREIVYDGIPFVHVKTVPYRGNGVARMLSLARFAQQMRTITKQFNPPSAVIHCAFVPFDLQIPRVIRKLGAKYIVEIADLWPASFVEYGLVGRRNPLLRLAYAAEHWLYHTADALVFTIEGGKDYVRMQGWHRSRKWPVSLAKIRSVNQGVDLADFDSRVDVPYPDADLDASGVFKVVYVGSIRRANDLPTVIEAALNLQRSGDWNIRFLIFGDGDKRMELERRCRDLGIGNVIFKGRLDPAYVPAVLSRADVNLFHFGATALARYGLSPNKLFVYFASGKPILSTVRPHYDLVERYGAGISVDGSAAAIADGIRAVATADAQRYSEWCSGARRAAEEHDYGRLAGSIIELLPSPTEEADRPASRGRARP
jgi:glycosyltransferase involved in cell wall biosynthesis